MDLSDLSISKHCEKAGEVKTELTAMEKRTISLRREMACSSKVQWLHLVCAAGTVIQLWPVDFPADCPPGNSLGTFKAVKNCTGKPGLITAALHVSLVHAQPIALPRF